MVSDRYSLGSECRAHDSVPHPKTETETNSNKPIILTGAEQLKGAGDVVAGHNHLGALRQSDRACRQRTQGCNTHQMSSTARRTCSDGWLHGPEQSTLHAQSAAAPMAAPTAAARTGDVGGAEEELRLVVGEEGGVAATLLLQRED